MTPDSGASARIAQALTYAGLLPFVGCTALILFGNALGLVHYRPLALQAISVYAAVIVSFLGGIQWGIGVATLEQQPHTARTLFLLSVVPSLLAWAMLFLPATTSRLVVALFLVGFVWVIDALLHLQKVIPVWFFRLRCIASAAVILTLVVALIAG